MSNGLIVVGVIVAVAAVANAQGKGPGKGARLPSSVVDSVMMVCFSTDHALATLRSARDHAQAFTRVHLSHNIHSSQ